MVIRLELPQTVAILAVTWIACIGFATTVDPLHKEAYGANVGWIDAGDPAHGAAIGLYFCSGYLYAANVGWISLGDGSPSNGFHYSNGSASDYGINHNGTGGLTGMAYGANIGWIVFEQTYGQPRIDLQTGNLSGYAWSPNAGWISLANTTAYVRSQTLDTAPDLDGDTIPDPWEYVMAGELTTLTNGEADADGDGASDLEEYEGDTDPFDNSDFTRITQFFDGGSYYMLVWTCKPTRTYQVQSSLGLGRRAEWTPSSDPVVGPPGPETVLTLRGSDEPVLFFRVEAKPPLTP